eukprot:SAG11_NODE_1672_length_4483_cov_3.470119_4_plen_105_part_00
MASSLSGLWGLTTAFGSVLTKLGAQSPEDKAAALLRSKVEMTRAFKSDMGAAFESKDFDVTEYPSPSFMLTRCFYREFVHEHGSPNLAAVRSCLHCLAPYGWDW